jgi:hypothetical protein
MGGELQKIKLRYACALFTPRTQPQGKICSFQSIFVGDCPESSITYDLIFGQRHSLKIMHNHEF